MSEDTKRSAVLLALSATFLTLAVLFTMDIWGAPEKPPRRPAADPVSINPATVRISAEQLIKSGGDTSILDCYACHDEKKPPPEIHFDSQHRVVLPKAHADLIFSMRNCQSCHAQSKPVKIEYDANGDTVIPKAHEADLIMAHGSSHRNSRCYNCHNPDKLNELHTGDAAHLTLEEGTRLCISCHGTSGRDWEAGSHGRTVGHWDRTAGAVTRVGCTSCHDPHSPAFPQMIPMPGPARIGQPPAIPGNAVKGL